MKLLAFDTSTELLTVAVQRTDAAGMTLFEHEGPGGPQTSATLLPTVQDLLRRAGLTLVQLDAIVFGRGPGSFTGLRTACAVAQGLAFGADVKVLPVDTLMAVAEQARLQTGASEVVAVLDARMDEVYAAAYVHAQGCWQAQGAPGLGRPEAVQVPAGWTLAGNAFEAYGGRLPPAANRVAAWPRAGALLRLAPALLAAGQAVDAAGALPLYIRDKVAQTTDERMALRAAAGPASRP